MQEWTVTDTERDQRLDKYLRRRLAQAPVSFLYRMLRKKNITLNGHRASGSETVHTGDRVTLFLSDETIENFSAGTVSGGGRTQEYENAYLSLSPLLGKSAVLYEDTDILLVCKPPGILSQKAQNDSVSINEWLTGYLLRKKDSPVTESSLSLYTPSVCSRLDRNTGGIVLCACSLQGSRALTALQRRHRIGKYYSAVIEGQLPDEGVLEGYLVKNEETNYVRTADDPGEKNSKWSRTTYRTVMRGERYSLLELSLETGRTHQLRVQLAAAGHPIAGDPKYGPRRAGDRAGLPDNCRGQLLWCSRAVFPDLQEIEGDGELSAFTPELKGVSGRSFRCPPPAFYRETVVRSK